MCFIAFLVIFNLKSQRMQDTELQEPGKPSNQQGSTATLQAGILENAVITVIGVGLISGSFALAMKEKGFARKIIGVSRTEASLKKAKELGIIDEALPMEEAVAQSDLIYLAIPVDATLPVMEKVMNLVNENQIVVDA